MALSEDMRSAIEKNMPALVAGELKQHLEQAERNASALTSARNELGSVRLQLEEANAKLRTQAELDAQTAALEKVKEEIRTRELALAMNAAKQVAEVAVAEKNAVFQTMGMFLRNQTIRTSIQESVGVPVEGCPPSQYNSNGTPGTVLQTQNTRTTTEEKE